MGTEVPRIRVRDFGALRNMQPENITPPVQPPQQPILLCQAGSAQQFVALLPNGAQIPLQSVIAGPPPQQKQMMIRLPVQQPRPQRPPIQIRAIQLPPRNPVLSIRPRIPPNVQIVRTIRPGLVRTYQRPPLIPPKLVKVQKKAKPAYSRTYKGMTYNYSYGHITKKCSVVLEDILKLNKVPASFRTEPIPKKVTYPRYSRFDQASSKCSKCKTVHLSENVWVNFKSQAIRCITCLRKNEHVDRSIDSFVQDIKKTILELSDGDDEDVSQILDSF